MSKNLGVFLVHIDLSLPTSFFGCFRLDIFVPGHLGNFSAYFPQFLLCYSLYTCFPQETKTKIVWPHKHSKDFGNIGHQQVMQDSKKPFIQILRTNQNFKHSDEAFHALKEVSMNMKMNLGKFGKRIKDIKRSDKDETKSFLSSISSQLSYVLLNSHQPLQMKMDEIFLKIHEKLKHALNPDLSSIRRQKSVCVRCGSDDVPLTPTVCACGMQPEDCRCEDFEFVPILLNHSMTKQERDSILIPFEGEEEIYPSKKSFKSVT